jgi:hypothetical protein
LNPRPLHCESTVLSVLTRPFPRTFLVAAFRSPQVPSRSLPSLSIRSRKVTPEWSWWVTTDRFSRPIGSLSQCAAIGVRSTRATITFLGEQQDITDLKRRCSPTMFQWSVAASKVRPRVRSCCRSPPCRPDPSPLPASAWKASLRSVHPLLSFGNLRS